MSTVSRDIRYDPNNVDHVGYSESQAKRLNAKHLENLDKVLSSPEGREFVWAMLERAGVFRSSFSTDPGLMAFNEGGRQRGLELLTEIMAVSPGKLTVLQREAAGREIEENHKWEKFLGT